MVEGGWGGGWSGNISLYVCIYVMDFPCGSVVENLLANIGDMGSISSLGGSPGEGNGHSLQ